MSAIGDAAGALGLGAKADTQQLALAVDGKRYKGWLEVEIKRSLDVFSHTFNLSYTDQWVTDSKPWPIREGAKCQLDFDNKLLLTGYVNTATWSVTETDWDLRAGGRSLSGDLEDCSAISDTGHWKFTPPLVIVNKLIAPFGLKCISTVSDALLPIETFELNEGETVHDAIDRLCTSLALLPISRSDGNLELVRGAGTWQRSRSPQSLLSKAHNALPIKSKKNDIGPSALASISNPNPMPCVVVPVASAIHRQLEVNDQNRYSDYAAVGQSRGNRFRSGKIITRMQESIKDSAIKRHRPLIVIAKHSVASVNNLKARAQWEKNIRGGRSMRYTVLLPGVMAPNKRPWEPGWFCEVTDPAFGVDQVMILVEATIRANDKSLVTELDFTLPEAYSTLAYPAKPINKKADADADNRPEPEQDQCIPIGDLSADERRRLGV